MNRDAREFFRLKLVQATAIYPAFRQHGFRLYAGEDFPDTARKRLIALIAGASALWV